MDTKGFDDEMERLREVEKLSRDGRNGPRTPEERLIALLQDDNASLRQEIVFLSETIKRVASLGDDEKVAIWASKYQDLKSTYDARFGN
jgi:hypothetical protein